MAVGQALDRNSVVRRRRAPHWGWLLTGATLICLAALTVGFIWPLIHSNRLVGRIVALKGQVGYVEIERPAWWPKIAREFDGFIPGVDELNQIDAPAGSGIEALRLTRYTPRLRYFKASFDRAGLSEWNSLRDLPLLEEIQLEVPDLESADLAPLGKMTSLTLIDLRGDKIDDTAFTLFSSHRLKYLGLMGSGQSIRGDGFRTLQYKTGLKELSFQDVRLEDDALDAVSEFSNLNSLRLYDVQFAAGRAAGLTKLTHLEHLILNGTPLDDRCLADAAAWTQLKYLELLRTPISDAGVSHLASVPSLVTLFIDRTRITDSAGDSLISLPHLQHIGLAGTDVSDLMLQQLEHHHKLRHVDVRWTRCTRTGIATLRAARPDFTVTTDLDNYEEILTE